MREDAIFFREKTCRYHNWHMHNHNGSLSDLIPKYAWHFFPLNRYNISLQNEKRELLNLENVILKMQNIVESALLEIYKLEDSLNDDTTTDL